MESTSWCICTYKYICVQPLLGGSIDPRTLKLGKIGCLGLRNIFQKFGKINFPTPLLTYLSEIERWLYNVICSTPDALSDDTPAVSVRHQLRPWDPL